MSPLSALLLALASFLTLALCLSSDSSKRDSSSSMTSNAKAEVNARACDVMKAAGRASVVIRGDAVVCKPNRQSFVWNSNK